jgi:hypothetical protein
MTSRLSQEQRLRLAKETEWRQNYAHYGVHPGNLGSLVRFGDVSYGGLWLACGTVPDFLFRALNWRGYLLRKHEFRKELFMNNDRFGSG